MIEYLDLDGDGVPDAFRTVREAPRDLTGDGVADEIETVVFVASGIGIDGTPSAIEVDDLVEVDFNHNGVRHVIHHSHTAMAA